MIETPFNYTGSKFRLLSQILPHFDYTKSNFVDLFTGGGSVYTNVVDKYEKITINDIISDLIGIHQCLINDNEIVDETKLLSSKLKESQSDYLKLRDNYNNSPSPAKLWALMLSCNSNLIRFNQKGVFNQTWGRRSYNSSTENKVNSFVSHIRMYKSKINFLSKNFNEIKIEENTFYYIDPPYAYIKSSTGDIGNKQISEAGYNNFYYQQDDKNLYEYCHRINQIGSTFMVSGVLEHNGSTSWILDKLIKDGFSYKLLDFDYNKVNKTGKNKNTKEIFIKNY